MKKLYVFALGGNEVSPTGMVDKATGKTINPDIPAQWNRADLTCRLLARIVKEDPDAYYVLAHGNGPQVGNILLRADYAKGHLHRLPLDVCVADTQGAMGYMLSNLLGNALREQGVTKAVAPVVTQVLVDQDDPAFKDPTKFIGPAVSKEEAEERMKKGEQMKVYQKDEAGNDMWRKVVGSPKPKKIIELDIVANLLKSGALTLAVGGGGIPVCEKKANVNYDIQYSGDHSYLSGVEAVIDKDLASSMLANDLVEHIGKDEIEGEFCVFTNIDGAKLNYQKPDQKDLRVLTVAEARKYLDEGAFGKGSMGPKIESCIEFIKRGGKKAYITQVDLFDKTLKQEAGTTIIP